MDGRVNPDDYKVKDAEWGQVRQLWDNGWMAASKAAWFMVGYREPPYGVGRDVLGHVRARADDLLKIFRTHGLVENNGAKCGCPSRYEGCVNRDALVRFCESFPNEWRKGNLFLFDDDDDAKPHNQKWPWGTYETKLLRDLAAVVDRFWVKNYDPSDENTAPKNEDIVRFLKETRGVDSNNIAKAIATILRKDGLSTKRRC
ncbi:MAG: hypothetical protein FWF41_06445 [Betaproteobacteria bacterium]|nr:hypothetical protein [Betaproteobacteria bacterium]